MRVAIIHEWLEVYAGSERVLEQMLALFPEADLFALVDFLPLGERGFLQGRKVTTTFIQSLPFARRAFRNFLPLFPLAVQQLDLSGYDLVLSSSHAVAKGVITGPDQLHISYVHSPMRYAWDLQGEYLRDAGISGLKGWVIRMALHRLRQWDAVSSNLVDHFIANSSFIARRIRKFYRRDAAVVWPPVDTDYFTPGDGAREDFYLAAARMVPYKRLDAILRAFTAMPDRRLIVIGDGPDGARLRAMAPPNVTFLGSVSRDVLRDHLRRARAEIYAGIEDFGIALVEAQAAGCPLIALGAGGARDIVHDLGAAAPTGVLFHAQTPEAISDAVHRFEASEAAITAQACRDNAQRFSAAAFREHYMKEVRAALRAHAPDKVIAL